KYMDRRCVYFRKPLLESETLGTKGYTKLLFLSSQDPPENQPNFVEATIKQGTSSEEILEGIQNYLITAKPLSLDECVTWVRLKFEEFYNNNIQQLLFNFRKIPCRQFAGETNREYVKKVLSNVIVPDEFTSKSGVKIQVQENET
ncbi:5762_t:CDS:2, partial [Gigaspora rosea]